MKAAIYESYGAPDVVRVTQVDKPTPKDNEVLVKIRATTVTIGDSRMRSFTVPRWQWIPARLYLGIFSPRRKILGMELAGDVEAIGKDVTRFKVGDAVFASTFESNFGAHAEYKCLPEDDPIALKPDNLTYAQAAAAYGGSITALRCLRKADIQPGQKVLIYGASGAVGSSAVQIVRNHFDAEVTAVCSTSNLEWVQALGASRVIDYTQDDFTADGAIYDVVFDAVAKFPAAQAKTAVKPGGTYLNVHRDTDGRHDKHEEMRELRAMLQAEKLCPVIDREYTLEQIVDAHRYVDSGHKKGNVVITLG